MQANVLRDAGDHTRAYTVYCETRTHCVFSADEKNPVIIHKVSRQKYTVNVVVLFPDKRMEIVSTRRGPACKCWSDELNCHASHPLLYQRARRRRSRRQLRLHATLPLSHGRAPPTRPAPPHSSPLLSSCNTHHHHRNNKRWHRRTNTAERSLDGGEIKTSDEALFGENERFSSLNFSFTTMRVYAFTCFLSPPGGGSWLKMCIKDAPPPPPSRCIIPRL